MIKQIQQMNDCTYLPPSFDQEFRLNIQRIHSITSKFQNLFELLILSFS